MSKPLMHSKCLVLDYTPNWYNGQKFLLRKGNNFQGRRYDQRSVRNLLETLERDYKGTLVISAKAQEELRKLGLERYVANSSGQMAGRERKGNGLLDFGVIRKNFWDYFKRG